MNGDRCAGSAGPATGWQCSVVDRSGRFRGHRADRCVLGAFERDRGSPGTVRSYAFDLRDFFAFLDAYQIDWVTVRLEHLGRFVAWLRLPPDARTGTVAALPTAPPHCSALRSTGNCQRWPRSTSRNADQPAQSCRSSTVRQQIRKLRRRDRGRRGPGPAARGHRRGRHSDPDPQAPQQQRRPGERTATRNTGARRV